MAGERSLKTGRAGERRTYTAALYAFLVNGALELGEIARIEHEIQKLFPPASPEPRCPGWPASPPSKGQDTRLH